MTVSRGEVRSSVDSAFRDLLRNDTHLLKVDANERSITHKFAEYLQSKFSGWNVDCEYNRKGAVPKELPEWRAERIEADDTDAKTVFPDIIVHRRGSSDNLLVIEAKKSTTASISRDADKLKAYKAEHGYQFAYEVLFPIGDAIASDDPSHYITEVVV